MSDADSAICLIRDYHVYRHTVVVEALLLLLMAMTFLLLLGVQPPFTTSLLWRLMKAAVLVGHTPVHSQTGWHTEPFWNELDACA